MIRYSLSLLLLLLLAFVAQHFVPTLTGLYSSRLFVVPLVFLCASVTVGPPMMLVMAYLCGFLLDTQSTITGHMGDPGIMHFGYSIVLYGLIGYLMLGIQPLFRQGKWQFSTLLVGVSIFILQLSEYLLINFVRGGFYFNRATFLNMWFTSALTTLFSPLVFWVLFKLADGCGYRILFDGLKKERRVARKRLYP